MLQLIRKQIVEHIVSDIGDRCPELPYGCLHGIAENALDNALQSATTAVQKASKHNSQMIKDICP